LAAPAAVREQKMMTLKIIIFVLQVLEAVFELLN
jgi:hypothetical protein